ncbi:MAG: L,D-transpeptidase family protein [Bacteroidetes bacterium]|nr:L,D-transpeptidase family protein [Bacteroidota bacterium]
MKFRAYKVLSLWVRHILFFLWMIVLGLWSCSGPEPVVSPPVGNLLDNARKDRVEQSLKGILPLISDSGSFSGVYLNFGDTLKWWLAKNGNAWKWFQNLISQKQDSALLRLLDDIPSHGLEDEFYHGAYLRRAYQRIQGNHWSEAGKIPYDSLALYILFSADACMGLYHDFSAGRVHSGYSGTANTLKTRPAPDVKDVLNQKQSVAYLKKIVPDFPAYNALRKELKRLLAFTDTAGDVPVPWISSFKEGDEMPVHVRKPLIRRLKMRGMLSTHDTVLSKSARLDENLASALRRFQFSQDLTVTGELDKATLFALNYSYKQMVRYLRGSLEKWRWFGPGLPENRIWVNVAANKLFAIRHDSLILKMNTCSGEPRNKAWYEKLEASKKPGSKVLPPDNLETPQIQSKITHLVANPTWYVPHNILVKEMLPEIRKDPNSLIRLGYVLKDQKGNEINPFDIDWNSIRPSQMNFRVEQTTGSSNSLGLVVIHFPNPFSIYMHDTPYKFVFGLDERHVSHGCVRLEKPFKLVEFLTSFNRKDNYDRVLMSAGLPPEHDQELLKKWKKEKLAASKDTSGKSEFKPEHDKYFHLDSNLPVYIVYFTAWQGENGGIQFSADDYKRDVLLMKMMHRPEGVRKGKKPAPRVTVKQG